MKLGNSREEKLKKVALAVDGDDVTFSLKVSIPKATVSICQSRCPACSPCSGMSDDGQGIRFFRHCLE